MIYLMIGFYIAGACMMLDAAHEANGSKFDLFGAVAAIFWPIVSLYLTLVGEADVANPLQNNDLQKSAGKKVPLKQKGNFKASPHLMVAGGGFHASAT